MPSKVTIRQRGRKRITLDQVACVTTFFDWARNPFLAPNHARFRAHWQASGIPLYTVECHRRGSLPQLPPQPNLSRVEVQDPLFHKESAINFAVRHLPAKYKVIINVDADMILDEFGPLHLLPALLGNDTRAVQVINRVIYEDQNGKAISEKPAFDPKTRKGFYGAGWAYRREFFDVHGGFFDDYPLGGLDTCALIAAYGEANRPGWRGFWRLLEPEIGRRAKAWCEVKQNYFKGHVRILPIAARHLWHGDLASRRYVDRHRILCTTPIDAYGRDSNQFVEFRNVAPRTMANVLRYWTERRPSVSPA